MTDSLTLVVSEETVSLPEAFVFSENCSVVSDDEEKLISLSVVFPQPNIKNGKMNVIYNNASFLIKNLTFLFSELNSQSHQPAAEHYAGCP